MPEIVSWSWFERSASPSWVARLQWWIERPNQRAIQMKAGYGISTSSASLALVASIAPITATYRIGVCTRLRSPTPSSRRTAPMSFTQRLMMSPVRQRK